MILVVSEALRLPVMLSGESLVSVGRRLAMGRARTRAAGTRIESFALSNFPDESSTTFFIETDHTEITLISMVAPSPD